MDFSSVVTTPDTINILAYHPKCLPILGSAMAAGFDCFTNEDVVVNGLKPTVVSLGFSIAVPAGYMGMLVPRSSAFKKYGLKLANTVGIIDSDYRGIVMAQLVGASENTIKRIPMYTRLCQLIFVPVATPPLTAVETIEELGDTERGDGGFGSTGD